jgi:hypothetical protein
VVEDVTTMIFMIAIPVIGFEFHFCLSHQRCIIREKNNQMLDDCTMFTSRFQTSAHLTQAEFPVESLRARLTPKEVF